jgi:hypothetical protein
VVAVAIIAAGSQFVQKVIAQNDRDNNNTMANNMTNTNMTTNTSNDNTMMMANKTMQMLTR